MFAVPFEEIAPIVNRTPPPPASSPRGGDGVQGAAPTPDADMARQREVADAFHAAARDGDLARLVAVLDPDVVLRVDFGPGRPLRVVHGPEEIAKSAIMFATAGTDDVVRSALVNGAAGQIRFRDGRPFSVLGFTIAGGRVKAIDILANPERLAALDVSVLGG